jgi:16S rRNA (cytosine1402-N4)-methyltransferase
MVQEALNALQVRPQGVYIDCTTGEGGHALAILNAVSPPPRVLGLDLDADALERARQRLGRYADNAVLVHASYANVGSVAQEHGYAPADGVLFDLGISSLQVDTGERGFSFRQEARLDMRFDPAQAVTAHQVVNQYSESELADIIFRLGEEPRARRVARAIARSRPIDTTTQLADVVARALGGTARGRIHPATRTFQAIRMAVNQELDNIQQGLEQAISVLIAGGRLAVISYHSLEDRLVKNMLRREASDCICPPEAPACVCGHRASIRLVSRKVLKPSSAEARSNPRSRSARMRVAERI